MLKVFAAAVAALLLFPAHGWAQYGLVPAPTAQYGAIPQALEPFAGSSLPGSVDLSADFPTPGDQGNQQSCVAWAVAYGLKSYHERKQNGWALYDPYGSPHLDRVFSPSFVYNQINGGVDRGSHFGDAFRVLTVQGAAPLSAMAYSSSPFAPIPNTARQAAAPFKIDTFRTVDFHNINELRAHLNAGFPIIIGARVDQAFWNYRGGLPYSGFSGPILGNHAMVVVGYDDARQAFKLMNSWGRNWGDQGFGWVSYSQFRQMTNEAYIVFDQQGFDSGRTPATLPTNVWTPPQIPAQQAGLSVTNVNPNHVDPTFGVGMLVVGNVSVPASVAGSMRIVVSVSFQNGGAPVLSTDPRFALPSGQVAGGAPRLSLNGQGFQSQWYAFIPYCALRVQTGVLCRPFPVSPPVVTTLVARPVLYLDEFGVKEGQALPFFVSL